MICFQTHGTHHLEKSDVYFMKVWDLALGVKLDFDFLARGKDE